jgi:hypothetical protein
MAGGSEKGRSPQGGVTISLRQTARQIEKRKKAYGGVRPAIRELSKESGIPIGTLKRLFYPQECPKNGTPKPIQNNITKETCTISEMHTLIDSGKKFGTIYADPPWPYQNQATRGGGCRRTTGAGGGRPRRPSEGTYQGHALRLPLKKRASGFSAAFSSRVRDRSCDGALSSPVTFDRFFKRPSEKPCIDRAGVTPYLYPLLRGRG